VNIKYQLTSNCWICEGWSEFSFEFKPITAVPIDIVTCPVKLHISSDDFEGQLLEPDEEKSKMANGPVYSCLRMLPPGTVSYYYTVGGQPMVNELEEKIESGRLHNEAKLFELQVPKTNIIKNIA